MTIHATSLTPYLDGIGLICGPGSKQFMTRDDLYMDEDLLVHAVRQYTKVIAKNCQWDSPARYRRYIADLMKRAPRGTFTCNVQSAYLLHAYAAYIPSIDYDFIDTGSENFHAWRTPTGEVFVDVVTTLALTEMAPENDQVLVTHTLRAASEAYGADFVGLRLIVLDARHESSFYDPHGVNEPLLTSPLAPFSATTLGGVL